MSHLVWSPVYKILEERIQGNDNIILILVPFAKLAALQKLHWLNSKRVKIKVVCRWRPEDIVAGVSDLEIYPFLKQSDCELYINSNIHLKLYVFASNTAFNTSGNMTLRGLGYSESANIEVGNMVSLTTTDWTKIYDVINSSRLVTDDIYQRFKEYSAQHPPVSRPLPPIDLMPAPKSYTISSLPATDSPKKLADFYFSHEQQKGSLEDIRRAAHDLAIFGIPPGLSASDFDKRLGDAFSKTPFVTDFIAFLKNERSLRFGAVNDWIHNKCEDVPLPYRWEIKENTRIFYDWLVHYHRDITWDRPNHSQVIYWKKGSRD
jgi:hypothetical protein